MTNKLLTLVFLFAALTFGQSTTTFPLNGTTGPIPISGAGVTQPALISPADRATFDGKQNALGFTPENTANRNAKGGYAALDANGKFPWLQLSGVPPFQAPLGFVPENSANKGKANGYASLNNGGQVFPGQLPQTALNTKLSQLSNDLAFVNALQAAAAAPVQTVNGQTGNVSIQIPTAVSALTNDKGYITAQQAAAIAAADAPVQTVNGQIGQVVIVTPTDLGAFTNKPGYATKTDVQALAPVRSVNGQIGDVQIAIGQLPLNQILLPIPAADLSPIDLSQTGTPGGVVNVLDPSHLPPYVHSVNGQSGDVQLPAPPVTVSQLINDTGYITLAQATAAAPVQSVNGQTGNVQFPIPAKLSDLPNDAGYAKLTDIPAPPVIPGVLSAFANDSGYATKTDVQQMLAALPTPPANVSQLNNDAGYVNKQQATAAAPVQSINGQIGNVVIATTGTSAPSTAQINSLSFPVSRNGRNDDRAALQSAINAARTLNNFSSWDSNSPYFGANVYLGCGIYALSGPLVLPRPNQVSYPNGPATGIVNLIGEAPNCVVLYGLSGSGWQGVTGAQLTSPGTGYTSTPTVAFSGGGCSTEPVGAAILMAGTTNVAEVYTSSDGSGCTSMPTCTISGGGGSGAKCEALGHGMIEWEPIPVGSFRRTFGQIIKNIRFRVPTVAGAMGIHFQMTNSPNSGGGTCTVGYSNVCERMMNALFEDLDFEDSNVYNPASIMISGDCNTCSFHRLSNNSAQSQAGGAYQTPLIMTSYWVDSIGDEGDGVFLGDFQQLACGGEKNGANGCFVGRALRSKFDNLQCDGVHNGTAPAVCYAFYNSVAVNGSNLSVEGTPGTQFLIQNSKQFHFTNIGIGSGNAPGTSGIPAPMGIVLINTDESTFEGAMASSRDFTASGGMRISLDAASMKNTFLNFEIAGTDEIVGIDQTSNYLQYCTVGSGGTCGGNVGWSHMGTSPY